MAILSIDDCKTVPQMMTLEWPIAKRLYHEACRGFMDRGWDEGESDEGDGQLVSRFHLDGQMTIVKYVEID